MDCSEGLVVSEKKNNLPLQGTEPLINPAHRKVPVTNMLPDKNDKNNKNNKKLCDT
jgi:hypothetical protein